MYFFVFYLFYFLLKSEDLNSPFPFIRLIYQQKVLVKIDSAGVHSGIDHVTDETQYNITHTVLLITLLSPLVSYVSSSLQRFRSSAPLL